ncbi:hypothetical protein HNV12_17920 [Methanococcoides sp. SA1]|nr:hypothetical protein [Methanococcoides sp. SA1]
MLDGISLDFLEYIEVFINAIDLSPYVTGSAQPKMNQSKMNSIAVALPPLEEQKRIVAKVDQLMTICDQLESFQQKKKDSRIQLNNSALNKMLDASSPEEFIEHWQLVCENFDLLYDNLDNVEKLKQAILQLAVQGKLVEQDANDEPADVLLEKTKAEKEHIIRDKKIKKQKLFPLIIKDETPFEIPENWDWVRLGEVIELVSGQDKKPSDYNDNGNGIPYITGASNIQQNDLLINRWISKSNTIAIKNDLLLTCKGTVGKTLILKHEKVHIARQIMALRPYYWNNVKYIQLFMNSYVVFLKSSAKSMIPGISRDDVLNIIFPLPPIEEQKRIVAKVDQLMSLCDQLEEKIKQAQSDSEILMEVAVSHLLEI